MLLVNRLLYLLIFKLNLLMNKEAVMRKYLSLVSLSILSSFAFDVEAEETNISSCETLGYKTPYADCVRENGSPLICPFATSEVMTLCMKESCRGFSLTDKDLDALASDGKKVRDHIASTEECVVGFGADAKTYYRVKECKSGSLYQNGICDVGCLQARYPYDKHPGDLPGEVEMCIDTVGKWYGFNDCNSGWVGGWKNNQTGKCEFDTCSIQDYPYTSNPNINSVGEDVNRGATLTCKIGSSTYYRYTAVDKDGNQLTENVCGISNNYTLSRGVCRKQCVFENCTNTIKTETLSGYTFSYNEFTCTQKTSDCRIGDMATFNGVEAGVIVHFPTDSNDKLRVSALTKKSGRWSSGMQKAVSTPLINVGTQQSNGKYNCKFLVKYEEERNKTLSDENKFDFQVAKAMETYVSSGCESIPICAKGEWYQPAVEENRFIYKNRYMLYNSANNSQFLSGVLPPSTDNGSHYLWGVFLSGSGWDGSVESSIYKYEEYAFFPMLSFYVR